MMNTSLVTFAFVATLCLAQSAPPAAAAIAGKIPTGGRRVALFIGNDHYASAQSLTNAIKDAKALAALFQRRAFETTLLTDVDYATGRLQVETFINKLRTGDVVAVYYAGHGMRVGGTNYIIPTDFSVTDADVPRSALSVSWLISRIREHTPQLLLLMLDACSNNPFGDTRSLPAPGWAAIAPVSGTYVAMAASPGQVAYDNPTGENGLFTTYLLKALTMPGLTLDQVISYVRDHVHEDSHGRQTPWAASSVVGQFRFTDEFDMATNPAGGQAAAAQLTRSMAVASRAIESNPNDASAYYIRSLASAQIGQLSAALSDLNHAIELSPRYFTALRERARVKAVMGDYKGALADCDGALSVTPQDTATLHIRALTFAALGEYGPSVQDATEVIRTGPHSAMPYVVRAGANFAAGRFREAMDDCDLALALEPENGLAHAIRGHCLRSRGQITEATEEFHRAATCAARQNRR